MLESWRLSLTLNGGARSIMPIVPAPTKCCPGLRGSVCERLQGEFLKRCGEPSSRSRGGGLRSVFPRVMAIVGTLVALGFVLGCGRTPPSVVLYAAQDRVFAEPVLREFQRASGIEVRALYDSEATKTVGLANRLIAESGRPQAEVWWSNEEMRTRQLAVRGVVEPGWRTFGARRRVWVVPSGASSWAGKTPRLSWLTNAEWKGKVAMAYPVFGSTTTHFLALRQRWGESAWREWCRALADNRPLVVDGNSVVVQWVARGDALLGITDSDDVAFAKREGLAVEAIPMADGEGLHIPNTVAWVARDHRSEASSHLVAFLSGDGVRDRMIAVGALDPVQEIRNADAGVLSDAEWGRILAEFDGAIGWLKEVFVR